MLGEITTRVQPGAKVLLCGEGADEIFLGYPVHRQPGPFIAQVSRHLATIPDHLADQSALLGRARRWTGVDNQSVYDDIVQMFAADQLVTRHLVPFDHGTMAHGIECRVPYLDTEVRALAASLPHNNDIAGGPGKPMLRRLLDTIYTADSETSRILLNRPPAAGYHATRAARAEIRQQIAPRLATSPLVARVSAHVIPLCRALTLT
jgi:asparagine synthetase B (glutamine-hydrolysing)